MKILVVFLNRRSKTRNFLVVNRRSEKKKKSLALALAAWDSAWPKAIFAIRRCLRWTTVKGENPFQIWKLGWSFHVFQSGTCFKKTHVFSNHGQLWKMSFVVFFGHWNTTHPKKIIKKQSQTGVHRFKPLSFPVVFKILPLRLLESFPSTRLCLANVPGLKGKALQPLEMEFIAKKTRRFLILKENGPQWAVQAGTR